MAGPGSRNPPPTDRHSIAVWYPTSCPVEKNSGRDPSSGPGGASGVETTSAGISIALLRNRQARALISSPSSPKSEASTICTFRPGRTTSASTRTGPIGTGLRISNVTRPT